jgi:aspartokinase/homoserine dehydrogenase 1
MKVSKTEHYLKQNIAVVTCNKIVCIEYDNYKKLKKLSRQFNALSIWNECGAGLPIIDTVKT